MPVYHSGILSKTDRPDFNYPLRPTTPNLTPPFAPRNIIVSSPYLIGAVDVRWDNPRIMPQNSGLKILGCNVYRSTDAQFGPYEKVTDVPITVLFYRDQTTEELVSNENATPTLRWSTEPDARWIVYAQKKPIVMPGTNGKVSERIEDVLVEIDDGDGIFLTMPAASVNGKNGEIQLISNPVYNQAVQQVIPPRLPTPPNGRVRISYRHIKHSVLTLLNQRIFYKVTTVAVDPKDPSKTIETPIEEVSDRSAFDIEMIDYVWREAINRNKWLLEQGGERVKIMVRKWMGPQCPTYEERYGQGHQDCHVCFPAGQEVTLFDGSRKGIESVSEGNRVLTVDGKSYEVTQTFERDYEGELHILKSFGKDDIKCTPEHPFFVIRKEDSCCQRYKKGVSKNKCSPMAKWQCFRNGKECFHRPIPMWVRAKDLKEGDYLLTPKLVTTNNTKFSGELMFLFGLFVAEGVFCNRKKTGALKMLRFCLGSHEHSLIGYTRLLFKSVFDCTLHLFNSKRNAATLTCSRRHVAEFFLKHCGRGSHNKKISMEILESSPDLLRDFVRGYIAGDGCKNFREGFNFSTVSKDLASQMELLLAKVNTPVSVKLRFHKDDRPGWPAGWIYCGIVNSNHAQKFGLLFGKGSDKTVIKKQHKIIDFGEFIGHPIINNKTEEFDGKVYNIEVAENHTYLVQNVVVHNCWGTSIVGGYSEPYEAIIAPPETERTVELGDMGLRMRYDWDTFMGPYPLLNSRDIVIRQNNERYMVNAVNPQGSRGAIYQQHFTISYLDQGDIRYKIPIDGQGTVPPAWDAFRQAQPVAASPVINNKPEVPAERIIRGRTVTFENISWVLAFAFIPVQTFLSHIHPLFTAFS